MGLFMGTLKTSDHIVLPSLTRTGTARHQKPSRNQQLLALCGRDPSLALESLEQLQITLPTQTHPSRFRKV